MKNEKERLTDEEKQTIDFVSKMDLYDKGIYDFYTNINDIEIDINHDFDIIDE